MPDKEKANSIIKMVKTNLERVKETNKEKFPSNIIKDYYDCIRELMSVVLLLVGYKTYGEGAHKALMDYLELKYKEFTRYEIELLNDLRNKRNKISYGGFFISLEYLEQREKDINSMINKLNNLIKEKLSK